MEEKYKKIEKVVCDFYKVSADDVYTTNRSKYPIGTAKDILMYLYRANDMKTSNIAKIFGISERLVYRKYTEVKTELKSETKIKEDIETIKQSLNI